MSCSKGYFHNPRCIVALAGGFEHGDVVLRGGGNSNVYPAELTAAGRSAPVAIPSTQSIVSTYHAHKTTHANLGFVVIGELHYLQGNFPW